MHYPTLYPHLAVRAKFRAGMLFATLGRLRVALTWTVLP